MPRSTVTQRLRSTLKRLLDAEGHGAAARLAEFSARRPGGRKIRQQDLSYFKHEAEGRVNPLTLDDLDDIADYFRLSIGELFGLKSQDLSGDEQRLIWAFRALPDVTREHFMALLESASASTGFVRFQHRKNLRVTHQSITTMPTEAYQSAAEISDAARLSQIRQFLTNLSVELALVATGQDEHGSIPSPSPGATGERRVPGRVDRTISGPNRRASDQSA